MQNFVIFRPFSLPFDWLTLEAYALPQFGSILVDVLAQKSVEILDVSLSGVFRGISSL